MRVSTMFIGWEKQDNLICGGGGAQRLNHKIGFRLHTNDHGTDITISADMLNEVGARKFDLLKRRDVYAFVPNKDGSLHVSKGQNRIAGIGKKAAIEMAKTCGIEMKTHMQHINAIVVDGAIVFPAEHFFNEGVAK